MLDISKKDALLWFRFFAALPEDEELTNRQTEIAYAVISQLEEAVEARRRPLADRVRNAFTLGGRTLSSGNADKFPKGCVSCLSGNGLTAVRKTNKCNLRCRFCYNFGVMDEQEPIGRGMWEIGGMRYRIEDISKMIAIQGTPSGVAYVYLEPFMEIEEYYPIITEFSKAGVYQHLYTNGTLADEENLRMLGESGLNELRFNLGASDCSDKVIENMALAKRFIPSVGIETPMTPEFYDSFLMKKDKILATGIDFINLAEMHLNENNIGNYAHESLYMTRFGYISPVFSRDLTLKLMALCCEENWPVCVHDCSNITKVMRGLNLKKEGGWFGNNDYAMEFAGIPYYAFIPALEDESLLFVKEGELPEGYRIGDIVI